MKNYTSLQAEEDSNISRLEAISRIEEIMLNGAMALAATRTKKSSYWIEREFTVPGTKIRLYWRDSPPSSTCPCGYSVQITGVECSSPEELEMVFLFAKNQTATIIRECDAIVAGNLAYHAALQSSFNAIATNNP